MNFSGTTELISLFLIVLLVYLLQCIYWVTPSPTRSAAFALNRRGRGKRRYQGFVWNAFDTAGILANPLPPLSPMVVAQWPAFELSQDAIQFRKKGAEEQEPVSISWEKLTVSSSESKLLCNGMLAFKGSEVQVREYAALLGRLQSARRAQRAQIIQDWLRNAMSAQAAARRVKVFSGRSLWLRIVANLEFFFLFLLAPLAFYRFGSGILWRMALILAVLSITVVLEFWTLHKTLLPEGSDVRLKSAVTNLLSPMAAIRASDVVSRDLLAGCHPLAAAGAVLDEDEFRAFAEEQLRLCRFGDYLDKTYQAALQKAMERALTQKKLNPQELLRPPDPDPGCVVYCPRCLAQYTKAREECSDCGYEALEELARVAVSKSS